MVHTGLHSNGRSKALLLPPKPPGFCGSPVGDDVAAAVALALKKPMVVRCLTDDPLWCISLPLLCQAALRWRTVLMACEEERYRFLAATHALLLRLYPPLCCSSLLHHVFYGWFLKSLVARKATKRMLSPGNQAAERAFCCAQSRYPISPIRLMKMDGSMKNLNLCFYLRRANAFWLPATTCSHHFGRGVNLVGVARHRLQRRFRSLPPRLIIDLQA